MVIRGESFFDWCQRTDNQSFLMQWDYKLNKENPEDIYKTNNDGHYFKCNNGHDSYKCIVRDVVHHKKIPECPICNSFGLWCEKNGRNDLLDRWDYDLNKCTPYDVSISSTFKKYFKCPKGIHKSELKSLDNIRKQYGSCQCIQCNSIGQFGIDNVDPDFLGKYVSEKNTFDLMQIHRRSMKKIWIKCQDTDYHQDYEITASNFAAGKRCPYCSKKKLDKKDSLGYLYPQAFDFWVEKKTTPYDYFPKSNKKVYWNCSVHGQYKRRICDMVKSDFMCPQCVKGSSQSRLQRKVSDYISSLFSDVRHEYDCTIIAINPETNYKLPYDNEIVDLKLIIEVNGEQHYSAKSHFHYLDKDKTPEKSFEDRQKLDALKKNFAIQNNYHFLEIPYWTDDNKETWKMLIDRKIKSIA